MQTRHWRHVTLMPRLHAIFRNRVLLCCWLLKEVLESSLFSQSESEPPLMSASSDSSSSSSDSSSDWFLAFFLVFSDFPFGLDFGFSFCELASVRKKFSYNFGMVIYRGTVKKNLARVEHIRLSSGVDTHILSNRYLGNRTVQTGNVRESQPQQSPQGVRSTLFWSSENTNKNTRFSSLYIAYI